MEQKKLTFTPPRVFNSSVDPIDVSVQDASEHGEDFQSMREAQIDRQIFAEMDYMMATRIVKYEVVVRLEGNGELLGLPDTVCEGIREAIQRAEGEGTLSGDQTVASAYLESVTQSE